MMPELQDAAIRLVKLITGARELQTPDWLVRPGKIECGRRWALVREIYSTLVPGLELPEVMRPIERRTVDGVLQRRGEPPFVVEFDEKQHFNRYRAITLHRYPPRLRTAFPRALWLQRCEAKKTLEGGGFAVPRPPLFPGEGGRHRQRAFRDALADTLPPIHGYLPTLRIGDFEVRSWILTPRAEDRMRELLSARL
jgi:hypothetical protein